MNPPETTVWGHFFGVLTLEIFVIVALAFALGTLVKSSLGRRSLWQASLLCTLLLITADATGLGQGLANWCFAQTPPERKFTARIVPVEEQFVPSPEAESSFIEASTISTETSSLASGTWWPGVLWACGFALIIIRILFARLLFSVLRRKATLVTDDNSMIHSRVATIAAQLGFHRKIHLLVSQNLTSPIAFGILRPSIALPENFTTAFTPAQQDAMLTHELAHLAARDPHWYLLADWTCALLWWNPLVWWARQRLHATSELAADEATRILENGPSTLAECLVILGKQLTASRPFSPIGVVGFRSGLGQRVERLLKLPPQNRSLRHWPLPFKIGLTLSLVGLVILTSGWIQNRDAVREKTWRASLENSWNNSLSSTVLLAALTPNTTSEVPQPTTTRAFPATTIEPPQKTTLKNTNSPSTSAISSANDSTGSPTNILVTSPQRQQIQAKLNSIRIPEVSYTNLSLVEVLKQVTDEVIQQDPEKSGVNFMINPPDQSSTNAVNITAIKILINPPLRNLRLVDTLDTIVASADHPIRYEIRDYAIVFSLKSTEAPQLFSRTYKVNTDILIKTLEKQSPSEEETNSDSFKSPRGIIGDFPSGTSAGINFVSGTNAQSQFNTRLRTFLKKEAGIKLDPPKSVFFNDRNGRLFLRATSEDLKKAEQVLQPFFSTAGEKVPTSNASVTLSEKLAEASPEQLLTRNYKVDPYTFLQSLSQFKPGFRFDGKEESRKALSEIVLEFMAKAGVKLDPPKSVFFNDRSGILLVRATAKEMEIIDQAVVALNTEAPQIQIEARFVEITQDGSASLEQILAEIKAHLSTNAASPVLTNLSNVYTNLNVTNTAQTFVTAILTDPQYRTLMKKLEQQTGADVLSTPKVTTLSGRQAQIAAHELRTIVTGLDRVEGKDGLSTNSFKTSSIPFGPSLDVIPHISVDGYSIQMTVIGTVTEFLGYDEPTKAMKKANPTAELPLPKLRVRQVTASSSLFDGQTVVLGGLIAEDTVTMKDKVPVLGDIPLAGRLFRSESKSSVKRNLIIFITPTIIDAAGNRVYSDDELPPVKKRKAAQILP